MTIISDVFEYLCAIAPLELQMDFDNSGFLVGHKSAPVSRAMLALDVTSDVINEAVETGCELVISHHPLIFTPLKAVTEADIASAKVLKAIEERVAVISMHTNLDVTTGGVNDALMDSIGASTDGSLDDDDAGRIGHLDAPMALDAFLSHCKSALNANGIRYHDAGRDVYKIAVMGGSGGKYLYKAAAKGCDTFLTADIKYDQFLDAKEMGINLIDADHFCTENVVIPVLQKSLSERFPEVEFIISNEHSQTACFF